MPEAIFGKEVIVEMLVGENYEPVLCGTDCSFTRSPEIIETTNPTSGLFKDFMIRREEWAVSVSGLTKVANNAALTFFYMLTTGIRRVRQTMRITFTDADGANIQISGNVLIGQESISGPVGDFAQCSIEMKGTGPFSVDDVTPPSPVGYNFIGDWWQTVNGRSYIDGASSGEQDGTSYTLLATDVILEVDYEGTQFDVISGTPAAGARECYFNTSLLRIVFPADLIFDGSQRVLVNFKRII